MRSRSCDNNRSALGVEDQERADRALKGAKGPSAAICLPACGCPCPRGKLIRFPVRDILAVALAA